MFGSYFFINRSNPWNCCVRVAFGNVLWPPAASQRIVLSLGKHRSCLDGPERGLFIPASYLWQWPMQGKHKKYQHSQLMDKPDQFRILLPSTPKSWAKLSPMMDGFKSLWKKKNWNKPTAFVFRSRKSDLLWTFLTSLGSVHVFLFSVERSWSRPDFAEPEQRACFPIKLLEHLHGRIWE